MFYGLLQHYYKKNSTLSYTTTKFQTAVTLVLTIKAMSIPVVLSRLARNRQKLAADSLLAYCNDRHVTGILRNMTLPPSSTLGCRPSYLP